MPRFYDTVPLNGIRFTADGYLVGEAPVARSGIQNYAGYEVDRPDMDIVRVWRPPEEVFSKDSLKSYAHRPITLNHPSEKVTADNWKDLTVGQTGDEVLRDGDLVRVPLAVMDAQAIKRHSAGVRELSMGYDADLEFVDGVTPDGEEYDAIQRNQRMNHLALVPRARGGERLRLGDFNHGDKDMPEENVKLRKVTVDGLSVETTDAGAQAIERLQNDLATQRQKATDAATAHEQAIKQKDADLAKKDAEIDSLKERVLDDAALDKRVLQRSDLLSNAKRVADIDYTGKSDHEIRKAAVAAKLGDEALSGKAESYIDARFDILLEDSRSDPAQKHLESHFRKDGDQGKDSQSEYEKRVTDGWKGQQAKSA